MGIMIWIWLAAIAAFGVAELMTEGLISVWFAVGSLGALLAAIADLSLTVQFVVFAVVSAVALAIALPMVKDWAARHQSVPTNLDLVLGKMGKVTEVIDNEIASGAVYVDGKTWTARSAAGVIIPQGAKVRIARMEGVKLIVETEKEEAEEEPFVIRPYLKSELAHKYNPHLPLIYAMQKLRGWIRNNKELYDAMYSGGEGKNDHAYSSRQVRLIVKFLDEP